MPQGVPIGLKPQIAWDPTYTRRAVINTAAQNRSKRVRRAQEEPMRSGPLLHAIGPSRRDGVPTRIVDVLPEHRQTIFGGKRARRGVAQETRGGPLPPVTAALGR